jgi:hypothetical protein
VSRGRSRWQEFVTDFTQRTALARCSDDHSRPFINDELITHVRLALAQAACGNVVRLGR